MSINLRYNPSSLSGRMGRYFGALAMFSDQANNFGTLISGVSTFILAMLAIATYWRWHTEKRAEKLSDVAESALNYLDTFKDRIDEWAKFANTWFIYNRQSPENMQNLDQLSSDERKKLADQFANDRFEVHNYCKEAYEIMRELRVVKYKAARLSNQKLNEELIEFEKIVKKLPDSLFSKHFPVADSSMKIQADELFKGAFEKVEPFYLSIHEILLKSLKFQNKSCFFVKTCKREIL